jgi:hypothetical protein
MPDTTTSSERKHMAWSPEWMLLTRGDLLLVLERLGGTYAALAGELRATWGIPEESNGPA